MSETKSPATLVAEMLRYVPVALPGAISLERDPGLLQPGYKLRYLKTREALPAVEDSPGVETAEIPIAAAWNIRFVVGIVLILLAAALAFLLPAATHASGLALIAVAFVVLGLAELWQSRLTPIEPDRLSLASAVMRARLEALSTDGLGEISQRVAREREIGDLLFRIALQSRHAGPRSWHLERQFAEESAFPADTSIALSKESYWNLRAVAASEGWSSAEILMLLEMKLSPAVDPLRVYNIVSGDNWLDLYNWLWLRREHDET